MSNNETQTITTSRAYRTYGDGSTCRRFMVRGCEVRAWDEIAGHYTLCHKLTRRQIGMIIREAVAATLATA